MARNQRKTMLIATAALLIALLALGATLALLTDQDGVLNVLKVGGDTSNPGSEGENLAIKVKIVEPGFAKVTGGSMKLQQLLPNARIFKDPKVVAVGKEAIYVRVYFKDSDNNILTLAQIQDLYGVQWDQSLGWEWDTKDPNATMLYLPTPLWSKAQKNDPTVLKEANVFRIFHQQTIGGGQDGGYVGEHGEYTLVIKNFTNNELHLYNNLSVCADAVQAYGLDGGYQMGWGNVSPDSIGKAPMA